MTDKQLLEQALEALENSVDLVRQDAYNAEQLYGKYPSRQARVQGLKVLADDHEKAITAIRARLEQPEELKRFADLVRADERALAAPVQEPTCKQSLQVWVIPNGKGAGQFSWETQDERFWTRMEPAAQRQWVGLTDEEIGQFDVDPIEAKQLIAKLKEKNT